ncbi:MAG: hypothetical protein DYH13_05625 [Alphaproteobacteria bacterium PRO2]|nr:hypothetical protein [Alphaproteobacteria bacterium PRO2]
MRPNNHLSRNGERGNVFLFILLGVILFAALAFAISRGFRSDTTTAISQRKAELMAVDVLGYAQRLERAVDRVRRNGCSESDISFENATVAGYEHTPVVDDKCKIFNPAGGGLSWQTPPSGANNENPWFFGDNRIANFASTENMGTVKSELVLLLPNVNNTLCNLLNTKTNKLAVWESGGGHNSTVKFTGAFPAATNGINRGNNWPVPSAGCFCDTTGACTDNSPRYFYYVLLVR